MQPQRNHLSSPLNERDEFMTDMLHDLLGKRLIFITGKGGVGKSTATAGLGLALAKQGKRVLIVETDTYSAMAEIFSLKLSESRIEKVKQYDNLEVVNLHAEDALVHAIKQFVPSDRVARSVIGNRVARVFFKAAPSVNEFSILNMVRDYLDKSRGTRPYYDHVIVDLPASGHAVTFLNVPGTLHGMVRVGKFAQMCLELANQIKDSAQTAIVAVCLPEEMPVNETIELSEAIEEHIERALTMIMLNMVHARPFGASHDEIFGALREATPTKKPEELAEASALSRVIQGNALALDWHERDLIYIDQLEQRTSSPIIEIPMFYEKEGLRVIERVADFLRGEPGGGDTELAS